MKYVKASNYFDWIIKRNFKSEDELEKILRRYPGVKVLDFDTDGITVSKDNKETYKIYLVQPFGNREDIMVEKVVKLNEKEAGMRKEKVHKLNCYGETAEDVAKFFLANQDNYNYFYTEVGNGDILNTKNGKNFVATDVNDFIKELEKRKFNRTAAPTEPKPTTVLPDDMVWAWSEEMKQWIAIKKDNTYSVADGNVSNANTFSTNTQSTETNSAVNYATAGMAHIVASLLDKPEIKRNEIEDDYFNLLMANQLISLCGVDFKGNTKFRITKAGLLFAKKASENELKKAFSE